MLKAKLKAIFSIISKFLINNSVIIYPGRNNTNAEPKDILILSKNVNFVSVNIIDAIVQSINTLINSFFIGLF